MNTNPLTFARPTWTELHPLSAAQLLPTLKVLDVRQPHEFHGELGHLPGAVLAPRDSLNADALPGWDREHPVLVVCRSGRRAAAVCDLLVRAGFRTVFNLSGGMLAWRSKVEG